MGRGVGPGGGGPVVAISLRQAIAEIACKLNRIRAAHGPDAIALYTGNPAGYAYAHRIYSSNWIQALGSRNSYGAGSQDNLSVFLAAKFLYGAHFLHPIPDLARTRYLFVVGTNPVVSQGTLSHVTNAKARLREVRARGGKIVVIDPRRTETAELADEHHFIRPDMTEPYAQWTEPVVLHNVPRLMRGERCHRLRINPEDATRLGLPDGDPAVVRSTVGAVDVDVRVTDEVMPGVVSLPHGWGHTYETNRQVVRTDPGANCSALIDHRVIAQPAVRYGDGMETTMTTQSERARRFRALHHERPILVIANAWDAASARVFELAGARAVGTTSAGLAWSLGYPDGQHMERALLVAAVRQIVRAVDVPVTVDFLAGYGDTPAAVCEGVEALIDAGAVGMNIEDGMTEPELLARKIAAVRDLTARSNVTFFVNARADTYLRPFDDAKRVADATRRLRAYEEAGADGLFAPGIRQPDDIAALVGAVHRPLNVMAAPGVPSVPELERLGVARVSVGAGPMQASMAFSRRMAEEFLTRGTYETFLGDALPYGEINQMFAGR